MRACPYCAEQIQDAAIVCRFCGRDLSPVGAAKPERPSNVRLPRQNWYSVDERVKARASEPERPNEIAKLEELMRERTSIWSKLGGALEILEPRALGPNRSGARQSIVRDYTSIRQYRTNVDRLTRAGWVIQHQSEGPPGGRKHIVVTWVREPARRGG